MKNVRALQIRTFWHDLMTDPGGILIPLLVFLVTVVAGFIVRRVLFRAVRRWAKASDSRLDVVVTDSLNGPIILWAVILGAHLALQNSGIPRQYLRYMPQTLEVLWILSLMISMGHLAGNMVRFYGQHSKGMHAVTSLTQKLAQLVVVSLFAVWMLKVVFDLNLTPILTTLGVGGLAVALALQDTLSNLFAGFYVSISGLVRIGDYIKLNSGEEGYVADINWRCTTMQSGTNSLIVIPNSKLGQAIYTNYSLPDTRLATNINVSVSYNADIDVVERILREEVKAATDIAGVLAQPEPLVQFSPGPGETGVGFQVTFCVAGFAQQGPAQSELRKRIFKRLRREGINMAPLRLVREQAG